MIEGIRSASTVKSSPTRLRGGLTDVHHVEKEVDNTALCIYLVFNLLARNQNRRFNK